MKIVHVIPHVSQEASGPSYSVTRLCGSLASLGHDVELSCLDVRGEIPGVKLDTHPQWKMLPRFAISHRHALALRRKAGCADIVHNHSLWSMVNVAAGWVVPGRGARLVTSPRGTLSEWALSRNSLAKKLLWPLQRRVLARADLLHATSHQEYSDIRQHGFTAPVAVIPNGIDLPEQGDRTNQGDMKTLLFLGRVHPTKCVDRLLQAWSRVESRHPDWRLRIVGPGENGYVRLMKSMAADLDLARVTFEGPIYGAEKSSIYEEADLYILPSHSENFGMTVAEALAHGTPVITTHGTPWQDLESEQCGWWIENSVESLAHGLESALCTDISQLRQMGQRGRNWMHEEFSWDRIVRDMIHVYRWLIGQADRPTFVRVD